MRLVGWPTILRGYAAIHEPKLPCLLDNVPWELGNRGSGGREGERGGREGGREGERGKREGRRDGGKKGGKGREILLLPSDLYR